MINVPATVQKITEKEVIKPLAGLKSSTYTRGVVRIRLYGGSLILLDVTDDSLEWFENFLGENILVSFSAETE